MLYAVSCSPISQKAHKTHTYAKWEEREMPCKFSMSPIAMPTSLSTSLLINLRHEAQQKAAKSKKKQKKKKKTETASGAH